MSFFENTAIKKIESLTFLVLIPLLAYCNYKIFILVPNEKVMGAVQRIFYFHVASAVAAYIAIGVVFAASVFYLVKKKQIFDIINAAAGEIGFLFCTIVLISGMIWGQAAWNTWFRFEPRLVSFLLIWLIFLSFNLLRVFADEKKIAPHIAILGIIGAITVPIMVYSIKLLPNIAQVHPEIIEKQGLHPLMLETLFFSIITLVLFTLILLYFRVRIGILDSKLRN